MNRIFSPKSGSWTALLAIPFVSLSLNAESELHETRAVLEQWVETRQIISKEKSDWKIEQSILRDTRTLMENELERVIQSLEDLNASATAADETRAELTAERETLTTAAGTVESHIANLEADVRAIVTALPTPLVDKIKPLLRRLPEDSKNTSLSMGERVQNIVGILSQADKFNNTITQTSESREVAGGKTVEVRTLYWGLAMAYYVDTSGAYAGIGVPAADGWEWPRIEDSSSEIKRLLDVYEGSEAIQFVEVPARIN